MSSNMISTGTTRETHVVAQDNVVYATAAPRGSVVRVAPHPPTPRR